MRILFYVVLCLAFNGLNAQMEVDHPIQLTGSGTNAKISGIQSVTNPTDVTSVNALQSGSFVYAEASGTGNNFILNISPAVTAYQEGMLFTFKSNQAVNGPGTLNINNLGAVSIKQNYDQDIGDCEILNGQIVTVVYDGTNFQVVSKLSPGSAPTLANAGPDQLNVPHNETITLAANAPTSGTAMWSIVSGAGGNVTNPSSPTSTFTGNISVLYVLVWTISNSCGTSTDTVEVSYSTSCYIPGTQTFNYTGGQQTFTVPCGVDTVNIAAYGAAGGSSQEAGGAGGYATGSLVVIPGEQLYVYVGGQTGTMAEYGEGGGVPGSGGGGYGGDGTDVRVGGTALGNRVIVAGGGGGGGGPNSSYFGGAGGAGGGLVGSVGANVAGCGGCDYGGGGGGGTQSAGGAMGYGDCMTCGGGCGSAGSLGQGGAGVNQDHPEGGGGGGGYYGGGGGGSYCSVGGGGGGSSYYGGVSNGNTIPGGGSASGNGQIVLRW